MNEAIDKPRLIALVTDFGSVGPYLGQMEALLALSTAGVPVINLCSDAPVCNPRASAYLLAALAEQMPVGTLFLGVVDPGVGGDRRALIVNTADRWFVGPDNGLFSRLLHGADNCRVWRIDWRPATLSDSFHGRDLFAPVAAGICNGTLPASTPLEPESTVGWDWPNELAEIIYIDHFGNAFSGIRAESLSTDAWIEAHGARIGHGRTFSSVPLDTPFWYRNSMGLVEIAVNQGRADQRLGLAVGDRLRVRN